eukprot:Phypoly_transcript_07481.p1 GENE.Phypoly_transcript_07481~~Phypoly_transcript_07481.p1  ORF type:complete len:527 (+),score=73.11 Phypoly_transcript_07481:44-1582(+)
MESVLSSYQLVLSLIVGVLAVLLFLSKKRSQCTNLPPCVPGAWPILGHLPYLGKHPEETLEKWGRTYGDVFSCFFGLNRVVVLNNYQSIKEAFSEEAFAGRAQPFIFEEHFHGKGLTYADSEVGKEHRKFALSQLRNFGMGKNSLQDTVLFEVNDIVAFLRKLDGKPTSAIKGLFTHHLANVTCNMAFGHRFAQDDVEFRRIAGLVGENFAIGSHGSLLTVFPLLRYVPIKSLGGNYKRFGDNFQSLLQFAKKLVDNHEKSRAPNWEQEAPKDYIDAFLRKAKSDIKEGKHDTTFDMEQLYTSIVNLFVGGTETTSTTLRWGLVYMIEHQEIQQKVFHEIETVVGLDRDVNMEDRANLPFTEATIYETLRCGNLATLGGSTMHKMSVDAYLRGYFIPKGTIVSPNFYAVHVDERMWENARVYDPTRFLNKEGHLRRPEAFIPFSIGKKACPGEALALMELFLFFANIIQKFELRAPPGKIISSSNYITAIARAPVNEEMCYISRKKSSPRAP